MKPKIFIGSSSEQLEIAHSIQQNLEHDATTTVWTQNIFNLSSTNLEDLICASEANDFAIFVFHPDDVTESRNEKHNTVRDNLIFELGLFIGKLGKERVFFIVPKEIGKLHLPTDLLGISPGVYDNTRDDGNITAGLGTFCNKVRTKLKTFVYENLEGVEGEPFAIKQLVFDKKSNWGIILGMTWLNRRMMEINESYAELHKGFIFNRIILLTEGEFYDWFHNYLANFKNYMGIFSSCLKDITTTATAKDSVSNKTIEIKKSVDRIYKLCQELYGLENDLYSINPPQDLQVIKDKLLGITKPFLIDYISDFASTTLERVMMHNDATNNYVYEPFERSIQMPEAIIQVTNELSLLLLQRNL